MVDVVVLACDLLSEMPDAENAIETPSASRIERAQWRFPVDQISKAAGECAPIRSVIVQKLRSALILSDANMAVIRRDCDNAVIPDLMDMLSRRKNSGIDFGHGLRIMSLIARVVKCRKAKFIFDPFPEIA